MTEPRFSHSATLLVDGRVLVAGGSRREQDAQQDTGVATVELFDPATGTWQPGPPMPGPRTQHRAIRLADGRVLIVGGAKRPAARFESIGDALLFDPAAGAWATIAAPGTGAYGAPLLLPDGRVLITLDPEGAFTVPPQELDIFDPATLEWTTIAKGGDIRGVPTAVLPNGFVLMVPAPAWAPADGGEQNDLVTSKQPWAFNPETGKWTRLAPSPIGFEASAVATLGDGRIALVGATDTALYNPYHDTWDVETTYIHLNPARISITMRDSRVMFLGAATCVDALMPPELLDPELDATRLAWGLPNQLGSSKTLLGDGRILVSGGELACPHDESRRSQISDAYVFDPFLVPPLTP
jgi:hypothetical protein